jgi:hypothetical protein
VVFVGHNDSVFVEIRGDGFGRFVVFEDLLARNDQVGVADDINPVPGLGEPLFLNRIRMEVSLLENFVGDLPPEGPVQLAWGNVSFVKPADEGSSVAPRKHGDGNVGPWPLTDNHPGNGCLIEPAVKLPVEPRPGALETVIEPKPLSSLFANESDYHGQIPPV